MSEIRANVEAVSQQIEAAAKRAGRRTAAITLVAVTKTHPTQTVIEAYQAGLRHFGENRTLEKEKVAEVSRWLATQPNAETPTWHFIGHLQSRQVGEVLDAFDLIHSVDSLKLAERINRLAERDQLPPISVLLQCNVSGEEAKSGFDLNGWQSRRQSLEKFLQIVDQIQALGKLAIKGLMTMAPIVTDPEETRPTFSSLAALQQVLQHERPAIAWTHLSMGMTDDFEIAIEEGATIIRVGRALFGKRHSLEKK